MNNLKIYFLIALVFSIGCNKEQSNEPTSEIYGIYESNRFIDSGSADGGVDIQAAGGYIRIVLNDNYRFHSELYIPQNVSSNYPGGHSSYNGGFSIKDDTILFDSANFIIDSIRWEPENKKLETFEVPLRGQPFKIVLYKYIR